jgi:hypothetical protein
VEAERVACGAAYATQSYTYAASGRLEVFVRNGPAEAQFYNGSTWTSTNEELATGMNIFNSNHEGVRIRNAEGKVQPIAIVSITRYTT